MNRVYLDHAADTPMRSEVLRAMLPHFAALPANPSSVHAEGRAARAALDDARGIVARLLGADSREIVFTSGGTEANNAAILGVARATRARGAHLITTMIEHRSVLRAFDVLRDEGYGVTMLPVDGRGRVDPEMFARAITPRTTFASIMLANNEIGTLQPIAEMAAIARRHDVFFHTDAVQAPGKIALDVRGLGVDLLSLSAHKFSGPKGVGVLFVRRGSPFSSLLVGGGQENGFRAGTENLGAIVGCARALELAVNELPHIPEFIARLRERLEMGAAAMIPGVRIIGGDAMRVPQISSMAFANVDAAALLVRLDLDGIAASAGSACAGGALERSHVAVAVGVPASAGVIRFSLGTITTEDDITRVLNRLPEMVRAVRLEVRS